MSLITLLRFAALVVLTACGTSIGTGEVELLTGADGSIWPFRISQDKLRRLLTVFVVLAACGARAMAGEVRELDLPVPLSGPSLVTLGPDGSVWASLARAGKILRQSPGGSQHLYDLPEGSFPVGLRVAPDGTVWYGDIRHNQIVRLDPADGRLTGYPVPTPDSWPFFLVLHPNGTLYFSERVGNKIGRLDPRDGHIEEISVTTPGAQPAGMTITPDGQIFFTQNSANKVGHLDPASHRITDLPIPSRATPGPYYGPAGIASDEHGNVWFAELDGRLGCIRAEARERIEEIPVPEPRMRPGGVAVDRWGVVWFTGLDGNMIASYTPATQAFRSWPIPSGAPDPRPLSPPEVSARGELPVLGQTARSTRPFGIAVSREGRVWFAEQYGHRLGYLDAPALEVLSPAGKLSTPEVAVNTLRRREHADRPLSYRLDGRAIAVGARLDLTELAPGMHRWEVVGEPDEGTATVDLFVEADLDLIAATATRLGTEAVGLEADLEVARSQIKAGRLDLARQALLHMEEMLEKRHADSARAQALLGHLRQLNLFGQLEAEVKVRADGCQPSQVVLTRGDRVRWWREGGPGTRIFTREGKAEIPCGSGPVARVTVLPRSAVFEETEMPGPGRVPTVLALDHEGNVWFTAGGGGYASLAAVPVGNRIGRRNLDGSVTEFETPTPDSAPTSLKIAPDGGIWFTERAASQIGHLDPATGKITEYKTPTPQSAPTGLAIARDGTVWFTEKQAGKIGRLDPRSGTIREIDTPDRASEPSTVVLDGEGSVWFDERGADHLVRLNPASGEMRNFAVPTAQSRVVGLVPDPRGFIWFLELGGHKVGRLEVASGQVVEFTIPTHFATPFKAALDSRGRLWFTEVYGNRIGVLDGETFHEFALPREGSMPGGIEIAPDGSLWFTQQGTDRLARLPGAASVPSLLSGGSLLGGQP